MKSSDKFNKAKIDSKKSLAYRTKNLGYTEAYIMRIRKEAEEFRNMVFRETSKNHILNDFLDAKFSWEE